MLTASPGACQVSHWALRSIWSRLSSASPPTNHSAPAPLGAPSWAPHCAETPASNVPLPTGHPSAARRDAPSECLEVVGVDLEEEVKLLGADRAVGHRGGQDDMVVGELAAQLDADGRPGGVARQQARRDPEPIGRLAGLVLVPEYRVDL